MKRWLLAVLLALTALGGLGCDRECGKKTAWVLAKTSDTGEIDRLATFYGFAALGAKNYNQSTCQEVAEQFSKSGVRYFCVPVR